MEIQLESLAHTISCKGQHEERARVYMSRDHSQNLCPLVNLMHSVAPMHAHTERGRVVLKAFCDGD